MNKKISIGAKPTDKAVPAAADAWVESRNAGGVEPMKRLTIDIPESLHRAIKGAVRYAGHQDCG